MSSKDISECEKDVIEDQVPGGHLKNQPLTKETSHLDLHRTTSTLSRIASRFSSRDLVDPGPPPDGGLKAWTQVVAGLIACFATLFVVAPDSEMLKPVVDPTLTRLRGFINSWGTFQTYYTTALGESQSTISWIGSVQLWVVFFISTFSGRALDAGFFTPTFIVGCVIQLFGIFMTSFCKVFWQLVLAQGICTGLGSGIL